MIVYRGSTSGARACVSWGLVGRRSEAAEERRRFRSQDALEGEPGRASGGSATERGAVALRDGELLAGVDGADGGHRVGIFPEHLGVPAVARHLAQDLPVV